MTIDGYCHCGISKYQPVDIVLRVMNKHAVDRAVLCQHLGEYDNSYLAEVVKTHPERLAAVCLIDPTQPDAHVQLRRWEEHGKFRGVRILAQWLEPYFPLWRAAVERGLRLVLYAPDGVAGSVQAIRRLLQDCPEGNIVISHLGNPKLVEGELIAGSQILGLEQTPGVFVLLSGLSMFCAYPYSELRHLVVEVIRRFGANRLMWGSNFPVCGDENAYGRDLAQLLCGEWGLSSQQIECIAGGTARTVWFDSE